jgi:hypothetical protein
VAAATDAEPWILNTWVASDASQLTAMVRNTHSVPRTTRPPNRRDGKAPAGASLPCKACLQRRDLGQAITTACCGHHQRDHNVTRPARGRALLPIRFFRSGGTTKGDDMRYVALILLALVLAAGCGSTATSTPTQSAVPSATSSTSPSPSTSPTPTSTPTRTHSAVPPPTHATLPATTAPAAPPPASCYPTTSSGHCYEPGEYCRKSDHGASGVAGDGKKIICEDNDGWRWEPV